MFGSSFKEIFKYMGLTPLDWLKGKDQVITEGSTYHVNFLGKEGEVREGVKAFRRSSNLAELGFFSCLDWETIKTQFGITAVAAAH